MNFDYHFKLIQRIVNETQKTVVGLIILSAIFIWIYFDYVTVSELIFWSFLQTIFIYLRYKNAEELKKYLSTNNTKKIKYHTIEFFAIIIYSAIVWNIGIVYMSYTAPNPYEFVGFILVVGLITAGVLSLLPIFAAYIIYFFMLLAPQIFIMFDYGTSMHQGVLLLSFIYIPAIYLLSKSIYKNNISSIQNEEKLKKISITDPLTHIYNRRFFIESAENFLKIASRENNELSLLMIDIDLFKNINDKFGHHGGDYILVELSKIIKQELRQSDLFARLGGEEFGILLSNTSSNGAVIIAKKICNTIRENEFTYENKKIKLTISVGVSQKNTNFGSFENLYKEADSNLYIAKYLGRDQVIASTCSI